MAIKNSNNFGSRSGWGWQLSRCCYCIIASFRGTDQSWGNLAHGTLVVAIWSATPDREPAALQQC